MRKNKILKEMIDSEVERKKERRERKEKKRKEKKKTSGG